jgi:hypothetical protein
LPVIQKNWDSSPPPVDSLNAVPSAPVVSRLLGQTERSDALTAVIVVDSAAAADPILGTRLAASHPLTPIYMWDPAARLSAACVPVQFFPRRRGLACVDPLAPPALVDGLRNRVDRSVPHRPDDTCGFQRPRPRRPPVG